MVYNEGEETESIAFINHAGDGGWRVAATLSTADLTETQQEIGALLRDERITHADADVMIRHLDAEIAKRIQ